MAATDFKRKPIKFSLKDIGSEIIDQLSSDIYSGPGSIMRELLKNAYDSYLGFSSDDLEDEGCEREIIISRERDSKKVGRILVADHGVGQTVADLKAFVQISVSKKQGELEKATGFRGLGSWSALGAGSKIIISSFKKGHPYESRLVMNVRKIYELMSPETTLDDILNNPECISFEERESESDSHGTTVEIECDGPAQPVNGHELNRLYDFTNPSDERLRSILVQTCQIPYSSSGGAYKQIHAIYDEVGYIPAQIILDGEQLERRLPADLSEINVIPINLASGKLAARAWVAEDPKQSREAKKCNDDKYLLGGPSIQLVKLNVPIGPKGIFNKGPRNETILKWHVGEVHILLDDVLPDASGQDLRAGTAREAFIEALQRFYGDLENRAENKSVKLNLEKKLKQGMEAAKELKEKSLTQREKTPLENKVLQAVKIIEDTSSTAKSKSVAETRIKEAVKDSDVKKARKQARDVLKASGFLDSLAAPSKKRASKGKKSPSKGGVVYAGNGQLPQVINIGEFQARIGQAIPMFEEIGLSREQIEQVLELINDIVLAES